MARKTAVKSAKQIIQELKSAEPLLFGLVKEAESDDKRIMFARGHDCRQWIPIPVEAIEDIEMLHNVPCGEHEHPFVRLRLKSPSHPEGELFSNLAALHSTAPLLYPAQRFQARAMTSFGPNPHLCWDVVQQRYIPC